MIKKNILYISPNFNFACGVSKHVFTLLTSDELKQYYNLSFITNGGDALRKLENAGIDYSLFDFKTDKRFHFDYFKNLKFIRKYCKEKKIDIIHSHHRYPEHLSNIIKKSLGMKTIVTAHNTVTGFKRVSYKSDFVIAISNSVKNHLERYYWLPSRKIKVVYNCVRRDIEFENYANSLKENLGLPQNSEVLLYVGRMRKEKGVNLLLKSFDIILKEFKNVFLVFIGDEKYFNLLNNNRIILLPAQEKIDHYYLMADMLILPSYSEGLGYSMLEAGIYKIPFIGSRTGGIEEFIEDRVNGYLFEPGNELDLADKISYLIKHPDDAKNAALKLNEKVLRLCNCKEYFQKMLNVYQTFNET